MWKVISKVPLIFVMAVACATEVRSPVPSKVKSRHPKKAAIRLGSVPLAVLPSPLPSTFSTPDNSPIAVNFRLANAEFRKESIRYDIYLESITIDQSLPNSEFETIMKFPDQKDEYSDGSSKKIPREAKIGTLDSNGNRSPGSKFFMKVSGFSKVFSEDVSDHFFVADDPSSSLNKPYEYVTTRIRGDLQLPAKPAMDKFGSIAIAVVGNDADSPFIEGSFERIQFESDAILPDSDRSIIQIALWNASTPVEAGPLPSPPPIFIREFMPYPSSPLKFIYATAEPEGFNGAGIDANPKFRPSYVFAVKRAKEPIEVMKTVEISSEYKNFPIFYGGQILKGKRYLLFMSAEDAWQCGDAFIVNPDGTVQDNPLTCEPNSC